MSGGASTRRSFGSRLARGLLTLWALASLIFVLQSVLPADPARMVAGAQARPEEVARVRTQLGLDRPLWTRYGLFWSRLAHGAGHGTDHGSCATMGPVHVDLGRSYMLRKPVVKLVADRFPNTLLLASAAFVLQMLLSLLLGIWAATRPERSRSDLALVGTSALFSVLPTFVLGVALQYVFAYRLRILPLDGAGGDGFGKGAAMILPALTLGLAGFAYGMRMVRDELRLELGRDHVRTARAKGASAARVLWLHALRGAAVPIATLAFLDLGMLASGAAVTESVFRWPGLGLLSVEAVLDRDGPVVMGTVLVSGAFVVTANLLADLTLRWLDPRLRG